MLAMLALVLVSAAAVLAAALYLHLERRYSTWRRKGVPGPQASVSLKIPKILRGLEHMGDVADRVYKQFRDAPIAGTYVLGNPVLHIHDPDILKQVLIKEFQDFSGRGAKSNPDYDPLSNHLFLQSGPMWRNLRVKLAPTFTSGKIKYMFQTILRSSEQLADYLDERIAANGGSYCEDARPLMMRLFVDTISLVILGIDSNVVRNPASEIYAAARRAVAPSLSNSWRLLISLYASETMRALRIRATDADTMAFFTNLVRDTVNYREQHGVDRADMLNLLMQLKNQGFVTPDKLDAEGSAANGANGNAANGANGAGDASNKQRLTLDEIAAQVFVFTIAGFESSAGTTSFTLYEMARNPAILEKALLEVDQIMADFDGKITYEAIMSMPYLEKCVSETLRKYPPLAVITREAGTTRKVPLTDVEVAKGTRVVVPIRALHYDPQYWPDPECYDPERFSEEQKASRPALAYLPFGDGPRICPAGRLGMVQIKTALLKLLSKYTVSIASKSPQKVSINPRSFATTPDIPLNITFKPRKLTSSS